MIEREGAGYALKTPKRSLIISGTSAAGVMRGLAQTCMQAVGGLQVDILPVVNDFFGPTVTCTGLLTGRDMLAAVLAYRAAGGTFDEIVLAGNTMKEFEDVFLCGMTLKELKRGLNFENIKINREGGYGFIDIVTAEK